MPDAAANAPSWCRQTASLHGFDIECVLPLGHEESHADHAKHYRYDGGEQRPIDLTIRWWDK